MLLWEVGGIVGGEESCNFWHQVRIHLFSCVETDLLVLYKQIIVSRNGIYGIAGCIEK